MTTLYLLRHGETEENLQHILQGTMPGHLTQRGKEQAREAALQLSGIGFAAVLSSDLQRCVDCAQIILEGWSHLSLQTTKLLRERDWGSVTGMTVDGTHRITIPSDAESVPAMFGRAQIFLDFVKKTYPNQTVLAVSHGLFCRALQAVHFHKEISDIQRMENAEYRILQLD